MKTFTTITAILFAASVGTPCRPVPQPTPRPTIAPIATPTASMPTPTHKPVTPSKATEGSAKIRIDLTDFRPRQRTNTAADLDYYAAATLLWDIADRQGSKIDSPALEISIRGLDYAPCMQSPCGASKTGPQPLGIVARFSGSTLHDSKEHDEKKHCGEGILYPHRLPLGSWPIVEVDIFWDASGVWVKTPAAQRRLGKSQPGFGEAYFPLPDKRGMGWAYNDFTAQAYGGKASLASWQSLVLGELAGCQSISP